MRAPMSQPDAAPELPRVDVWLVDGFNALHAVVLGGDDRERFWQGAPRERLIERLARGLTGGDHPAPPIVVVFDGRRPVEGDEAHPAAGLEVVFAPSADDWIVRRVRAAAAGPAPPQPGDETAARAGERIGVVTNDRRVAGRCRHAGAAVVPPATFMAHLAAAPEPAYPDGIE